MKIMSKNIFNPRIRYRNRKNENSLPKKLIAKMHRLIKTFDLRELLNLESLIVDLIYNAVQNRDYRDQGELAEINFELRHHLTQIKRLYLNFLLRMVLTAQFTSLKKGGESPDDRD